MTSATWTSKSNKTMSLTATVTGETSKDMVAVKYSLTIDGQQYKVIGPKASGILEILVKGTTKALVQLPAEVAAEIDAEVASRKAEITAKTPKPTMSQYDINFGKMTRIMDAE